MVDWDTGSLLQLLGMPIISCPPAGIWFLGVSDKVSVEAVLT